jgi:hypothetical protein
MRSLLPSDSFGLDLVEYLDYSSLKNPLALDPKAGVSTFPLFFFSGTEGVFAVGFASSDYLLL